jgi:hypothetical protein
MLRDNISNVGWPACGEIDIMEYANRVDKVTAALSGRSEVILSWVTQQLQMPKQSFIIFGRLEKDT